jgi:hypothetical protein
MQKTTGFVGKLVFKLHARVKAAGYFASAAESSRILLRIMSM